MLLTRLLLEGPRHADGLELSDLGALVRLPEGPGAVAVADALSLLAGGLDTRRAPAVAAALGWWGDGVEVHGDPPRVDQLTGLDADGVRAVVGDARSVRIEAEIALDPPLFGRLREGAVRDPRVVTALGRDPTLTVAAGWLLTSDLRAAAPSTLTVRVGDVSFATSGKECPAWLPPLLEELGTRFGRLSLATASEGLTERLIEASLSPDPDLREGLERVLAAVQEPPFSLPRLELLRSGLAFGTDLIRARQLGRAAVDAVAICEAALLDAPDVLVVDDAVPDDVVAWLEARTDGEGATLEQVFVP